MELIKKTLQTNKKAEKENKDDTTETQTNLIAENLTVSALSVKV